MHRTEKKSRWPRRILLIALMVSVIAALLSQTVFAQNNYVITDGDSVTMHKSYSTDPDVVLDEAGIELSEEDTYTATYTDGVGRIDIQRMQMVTVVTQGRRNVIGTYGETVSALLSRMDITLGPDDVLSCDRDALTYDGMVVEIVHRETDFIEYDKTLPFAVKYFEDPSLEPGEEIVLIEGVDGLVHYREQVVTENGVEVSRQVVDETVVTETVAQLIVKGVGCVINEQPDEPDHGVSDSAERSEYTAQPGNDAPAQTEPAPSDDGPASLEGGQITTSTGRTYTYTDVLTVSATAYSCEGYTGYTYSGTVARVGAIAVDPKVIPLGTKMYVVSNDGQYVYGYCVAEDIGGGIKGNKIDLYFDTFDECWAFGVRTCTVYILE